MTPRKKTSDNTPTKKRAARRANATDSAKKTNTPSSPPVDSPAPAASFDKQPVSTGRGAAVAERQRRIAETAYRLFQQRGGEHGHALEDWLRAERQIDAEERRRQRP
jgi:hypothetical protein